MGEVEKTGVVGDGSDDGDDASELVVTLISGVAIALEVSGDAGNGDGVAIEFRLVESFVDDLVELSIGPAGQEGVKLTRATGTLIKL